MRSRSSWPLRAPNVRVAAITVVAGNGEVQQATRNALYTVELCGANVPVYAGAARPLLRPCQNATWFHGRDGLGDHSYPAPRHTARPEHAVDAILETIEANPGIVLVTLGPLTNAALAVTADGSEVAVLQFTAPIAYFSASPTFFAEKDKESFHIDDRELAELFLSRVLKELFQVRLLRCDRCRRKSPL
jgi:hypothetical protein